MGEEFMLIIKQIIMMFLMVSVGYIVYKKKILDDYTTKHMTDLVLYVVSPCIMFVSFIQEFSIEKLIGFGIVIILSFLFIGLGLLIGRFLLGKENTLEQYGCGFSNAGFIGIPLVQSLLGIEYVFYVSAFTVAFNMLTWTIGLSLISGKNNFNLKKFITNPAILSTFLGMFIFIFQIQLPNILTSTIQSIGNMNTPLGMIILGTYIAKEDLFLIFKSKMGYLVSLIRLLILPLITVFILKFIYVPYEEIKMVLLICCAAPCGATLAMFSQMCGKDYSYGARIVSLSTILCPLTIVSILTLARMIW